MWDSSKKICLFTSKASCPNALNCIQVIPFLWYCIGKKPCCGIGFIGGISSSMLRGICVMGLHHLRWMFGGRFIFLHHSKVYDDYPKRPRFDSSIHIHIQPWRKWWVEICFVFNSGMMFPILDFPFQQMAPAPVEPLMLIFPKSLWSITFFLTPPKKNKVHLGGYQDSDTQYPLERPWKGYTALD